MLGIKPLNFPLFSADGFPSNYLQLGIFTLYVLLVIENPLSQFLNDL